VRCGAYCLWGQRPGDAAYRRR